MTHTTDLATRNNNQQLVAADPAFMDEVRRLIAPAAKDAELALFAQVCQRTGLDPFSRQIYLLSIQGKHIPYVGIDGLRVVAQRSRRYGGQTEPEWTADGVTWVTVWLKPEPPAACRVGVRRLPGKEPTYATAVWSRSAKNTPIWKERHAEMLAKVAEAQALRKAFPAELADSSYLEDDDEEMLAYKRETAREYDRIFGTEDDSPYDLQRKPAALEAAAGAPESDAHTLDQDDAPAATPAEDVDSFLERHLTPSELGGYEFKCGECGKPCGAITTSKGVVPAERWLTDTWNKGIRRPLCVSDARAEYEAMKG